MLAQQGRSTPERERERDRERERNADNENKPKTKHKPQVRGPHLGVVAVVDVRVDDVERGQEENTRGTTNRNAVCGSPAPGEREKRDATTANKKQPNNKRTRERERDPNKHSNMGRVLKGDTKAYKNLCFRAKTQAESQKPTRKKAETSKRNHRSEKQRIGGVAGPMGRPATFRGRSWGS